MRKNNVSMLFKDEEKRKNKIISYFCVVFLITVIAFSFSMLFVSKNKTQYVGYTENGDVNYKVFLKKNDFFEEEHLGKNNQYISSLIDYIHVNFDYKVALDKTDIKYKYAYKIIAEVAVKDKITNKSIYRKEDTLLDEITKDNALDTVNITEQVNIDYNHYNELIKKFLSTYNLGDVVSTLNIKMLVNVSGTCEELNKAKQSYLMLQIPLATDTTSFDTFDNILNLSDNVMLCQKPSTANLIYLIVSLSLLILDIYVVLVAYRYIKKTQTAQNIYKTKLRKILKNYSSYIQKVDDIFDISNYEIVKISDFTDMLEIRDTIGQPILMVESKQKNGVYFAIPSSTNILYLHGLKVSSIQKHLSEE